MFTMLSFSTMGDMKCQSLRNCQTPSLLPSFWIAFCATKNDRKGNAISQLVNAEPEAKKFSIPEEPEAPQDAVYKGPRLADGRPMLSLEDYELLLAEGIEP